MTNHPGRVDQGHGGIEDRALGSFVDISERMDVTLNAEPSCEVTIVLLAWPYHH